MKILQSIAHLVLSFLALLPACVQAQKIAIVDVTVVPMDRARVLPHRTVLVEDGVIRTIGRARSVRIPEGAEVVDGSGLWLVPGLADMHAHVSDPADFPRLLEAGVTTTLNMGGASADYRQRIRPALRERTMEGPYPLVAMMIDGPGDPGGSAVVPKTTDEARAYVRDARRNGYDYVKVYSRLQPEMFEAVMDEARRARMPVVGHVVRSVGLSTACGPGR